MSLTVKQLQQVLSMVGDLVDEVGADQWSAPTPCTDWDVRDLVGHLVGVNMVFTALLRNQEPPERGTDPLGEDPADAYRQSARGLVDAFNQHGVLDRAFSGPLGTATGAERLHIRIADLLAHGWDLARATDRAVDVPEEVVEQELTFMHRQLDAMPREGRFEPVQPVADEAPAIDRFVAFLGRSPSWGSG